MFNNPTFNLEDHTLMFKKPVTKTSNTIVLNFQNKNGFTYSVENLDRMVDRLDAAPAAIVVT